VNHHCAGPCDQGRKPCPCPEACGVPQNEDAPQPDMVRVVLGDAVIAVLLVGIIAAVVLGVVG
jgi:hypothetical protein